MKKFNESTVYCMACQQVTDLRILALLNSVEKNMAQDLSPSRPPPRMTLEIFVFLIFWDPLHGRTRSFPKFVFSDFRPWVTPDFENFAKIQTLRFLLNELLIDVIHCNLHGLRRPHMVDARRPFFYSGE